MTSVSSNIPEIETERLLLRAPRVEDLDGFYSIYADARHARFVSRIADKRGAFEKMAALIGHWHLRGWGRFAVELKSEGRFIGHCGANQPEAALEPELNYSFVPDVSGRGFAFEAVSHVLAYLYTVKGWQTAVSEINIDNAPSIALARRLGAAVESRRTEPFGTLEIWRHLSPGKFFDAFPRARSVCWS